MVKEQALGSAASGLVTEQELLGAEDMILSSWHLCLGLAKCCIIGVTKNMSSLFFFFLVRKIRLELTSMPVFLHFVCGSLPQHG